MEETSDEARCAPEDACEEARCEPEDVCASAETRREADLFSEERPDGADWRSTSRGWRGTLSEGAREEARCEPEEARASEEAAAEREARLARGESAEGREDRVLATSRLGLRFGCEEPFSTPLMENA